MLGIDVSNYNKITDWNALRNSIDFMLIRVGWGSDDTAQDDPNAFENMNQCEALGIPYGVYLYSYALNMDDVRSEIKHMQRLIEGRNPELGVWFDMEDADGYKGKHSLPYVPENKTIFTSFCVKFCEAFGNAGVYTSSSHFKTHLELEQLSKFNLWVADWGDNKGRPGTEPKGFANMRFWQYTSKGVLPGVKGNVDMNMGYYKAVEPAPVPTPVPTPKTHAVQPGETLSGIAMKYGTTYQELARINNIANPNLIHPGDLLKLADGTTAVREHVVQAGETLSGIAAKYGTTYQFLAAFNGIANPNLIHPGQVIKFPQ